MGRILGARTGTGLTRPIGSIPLCSRFGKQRMGADMTGLRQEGHRWALGRWNAAVGEKICEYTARYASGND